MLTICLKILAAMLSTIAFSILFTAPGKEVLWCGLFGLFTWGTFHLFLHFGLSETGASLLATFLLVMLARMAAVLRKVPATVYLLTGIFQLVPGAGIYYTAYYLFTGQPQRAGSICLNAFESALSIVFGILFGFSLPQSFFLRVAHFCQNKGNNSNN
jgi:uncharacterized membrane protein YjjB (DUF3815 family)